MIGSGLYVGNAGQQVVGPISEDLFIQGKAFSYQDYMTFGADETKIIGFDSSVFTGQQIIMSPLLFGASAGPVLIDIYTGSTFNADGTVLAATNRREGFSSPQSVLREGPTGYVAGTRFFGDSVLATGAGVGNVNPNLSIPGLPFEISPAVNHSLQITNTNGAGTIVQIKITWFEV